MKTLFDCKICPKHEACSEVGKPFLLGSMEATAILVSSLRELSDRSKSGEIACFQTHVVSSKLGNKVNWSAAITVPKSHGQAANYQFCQTSLMEIVVKEHRWAKAVK